MLNPIGINEREGLSEDRARERVLFHRILRDGSHKKVTFKWGLEKYSERTADIWEKVYQGNENKVKT